MSCNFNFFSPTKTVFGRGSQKQVGSLIKEFGGSRVLIVYGSDRVIKSGLMEEICSSLAAEGIFYETLGGVVPNPHLSLVYKGIEMGKKSKVDFLLAVGGGSVIDTAKGIAYGLGEPDRDVWELFAHTRKSTACLPVGAVLTIAAAGSESSDSTVITNEVTLSKRGYNSDLCRPKFAVMNPELTLSLPDYQTESGCADIMMHTMERYFVNGGTMEITDSMAEGLLRTVMECAKILHTDPENYEARAEVMWASSLSHNGLTGCGSTGSDFSTHVLEHELGGMFDVTHGAGLAALWCHWATYVYKDCLPRFVRFATNVMGVEPKETDEETALAGIEAMREFYREIGMPTNMKELGIEPTDEQCRELAKGAAAAAGGKKGSAKVLFEEDMYNIYKMSL